MSEQMASDHRPKLLAVLVAGFAVYGLGDLPQFFHGASRPGPGVQAVPMTLPAASSLLGHLALAVAAVVVGASVLSGRSRPTIGQMLGALWMVLLLYYSMSTYLDGGIFPLTQVLMVLMAVISFAYINDRTSARRLALFGGGVILLWSLIDDLTHLVTWITATAPAGYPYLLPDSPARAVTDLFWLVLLLAVIYLSWRPTGD